MTEAFKQQIEEEARQAVTELLAQAKLRRGDVFVVGCSSSEIVGGHIGKDSSLEAAQAVYAGIAPVLAQQGIWLAAQCCEHLNRAIIIEREAAEKYGWEEVCVVPRPHAGGSWATTCWKQFRDPIAVEELIIPEQFDETYSQYLELQASQGFDLTDYCGKRVKRYTYEITNYPTGESGIQAGLLVYKSTVIGGDVLSAQLGGFIHGLEMPA